MKNKCYNCGLILNQENKDKMMIADDGNVEWNFCKECADEVRDKFFNEETSGKLQTK